MKKKLMFENYKDCLFNINYCQLLPFNLGAAFTNNE